MSDLEDQRYKMLHCQVLLPVFLVFPAVMIILKLFIKVVARIYPRGRGTIMRTKMVSGKLMTKIDSSIFHLFAKYKTSFKYKFLVPHVIEK